MAANLTTLMKIISQLHGADEIRAAVVVGQIKKVFEDIHPADLEIVRKGAGPHSMGASPYKMLQQIKDDERRIADLESTVDGYSLANAALTAEVGDLESRLNALIIDRDALLFQVSALKSQPPAAPRIQPLSAKVQRERDVYRKTLEYVAEFVSARVFERCFDMGKEYTHVSGIVGDVAWHKRGNPRKAKSF